MPRRIIIGTGIVIAIVILLSEGHVLNAILSLMLAGSIPGTSIVIPFWIMMAIYCTAISLLITWYIESTLLSHRTHKATTKQRMPRRRYSHI